ncbi:hypothetical protein GCM10027614_47060 [Micromonospora vulcania]
MAVARSVEAGRSGDVAVAAGRSRENGRSRSTPPATVGGVGTPPAPGSPSTGTVLAAALLAPSEAAVAGAASVVGGVGGCRRPSDRERRVPASAVGRRAASSSAAAEPNPRRTARWHPSRVPARRR